MRSPLAVDDLPELLAVRFLDDTDIVTLVCSESKPWSNQAEIRGSKGNLIPLGSLQKQRMTIWAPRRKMLSSSAVLDGLKSPRGMVFGPYHSGRQDACTSKGGGLSLVASLAQRINGGGNRR